MNASRSHPAPTGAYCPPALRLCWLVAALLLTAVPWLAPAAPASTNEDFPAVRATLVRLLQSCDAVAFARALTPSLADWQLAMSTRRPSPGDDPLGPAFAKRLEQQRQQLEAGARRLLAKAVQLRLDFSRARLTAKANPVRAGGRVGYDDLHIELPWVQTLEMVLEAEPTGENKEAWRSRGQYRVLLRGLVQFPSGWRCTEGVQWLALPAGLLDQQTQCELVLLARAAEYKGVSQADDPHLTELGQALLRFVQERKLQRFGETLQPFVMVGSQLQGEPGQQHPARPEAEQEFEKTQNRLCDSARQIIAQMDRFGIDLRDAQLRLAGVTAQSLIARGGAGEIEGLEGNQLVVEFNAQSTRQSRRGTNLSGHYALGLAEAVRRQDRWWPTGNIQWRQFPAGVLDAHGEADLQFENYVAENGTLPPGAKAPDIEFVRLDDRQKLRLADWRGKVVVLDFWAVGCGPCQAPLAEMQHYGARYPAWKDRVVVAPLSLDNSFSAARAHLEKRGWTNTCNVWAGPDGWESAAARAFRITGIPTCYVIDPQGTIVEVGHFLDVTATVEGLLK